MVDRLLLALKSWYDSGDQRLLVQAEAALVAGDTKGMARASAFFGVQPELTELHSQMLRDYPTRCPEKTVNIFENTHLQIQQFLDQNFTGNPMVMLPKSGKCPFFDNSLCSIDIYILLIFKRQTLKT